MRRISIANMVSAKHRLVTSMCTCLADWARDTQPVLRRWPPAHDANLFTGAQLRFNERGAVVHSGIFELRNVLQRELPVFRAGRDDDRTREYCAPSSVSMIDCLVLHLSRFCSLRDHQVRAEFQCLRVGARRQLLARDPGGKAEVVLDP